VVEDVSRTRKLILGSFVSGAIGLAVGILAATLYTWRKHPNDPDPVDFTIGSIFLLTTLGVWLLGSGFTLWLMRRRH
jgi:hypothetical protein